MRSAFTNRRRFAVALLVAGVVAGGSIGIAAAQSRDGAAGTLADAVQASAQYHRLAVAKANGYGLLVDKNNIACIAMDDMPAMGAMGIHYVNGGLVGDGTIDASKPEAVVYEPEANGQQRLVALEYVVLKSAWDANHASPPTLFGQEFNFTPDGNRFGLPPFYSLHAWIWKHNPSGMFSMWNPEVSCAAAG
jgi:hypothetical protein